MLDSVEFFIFVYSVKRLSAVFNIDSLRKYNILLEADKSISHPHDHISL